MGMLERSSRLRRVAAIAALTAAGVSFRTLSASAHDGHGKGDKDDEKLVLTFSTVGDSRQDPVNFDPTTAPLSPQDAIWLENSKALARIAREVEGQRADFLFFNGDMIMGYGNMIVPSDTSTVDKVVGSDLVAAYRQYGFWRGMVAGLMERGTYVVPVPGIHETQCKACGTGKIALPENEDAWRRNMADLILDDTRFGDLFGEFPTYEATGDNRAAADGLTTDQSKLSYSFDFRDDHFAIVNTDPVGNDSHAPTNWLAQDLADAQARGAKHFFVFGHKPAFTYYYGASTPLPTKPAGLDAFVPDRDAFWSVIEQYGAFYFCGHEHIFNLSQPTAGAGGASWQVLVGSGGSPFEATPTDDTIHPDTDRDYAWATVQVYSKGTVRITAYGFDDQFGPTRRLESHKIKK